MGYSGTGQNPDHSFSPPLDSGFRWNDKYQIFYHCETIRGEAEKAKQSRRKDKDPMRLLRRCTPRNDN
jgi:hypothetical protein